MRTSARSCKAPDAVAMNSAALDSAMPSARATCTTGRFGSDSTTAGRAGMPRRLAGAAARAHCDRVVPAARAAAIRTASGGPRQCWRSRQPSGATMGVCLERLLTLQYAGRGDLDRARGLRAGIAAAMLKVTAAEQPGMKRFDEGCRRPRASGQAQWTCELISANASARQSVRPSARAPWRRYSSRAPSTAKPSSRSTKREMTCWTDPGQSGDGTGA